MLPSRSSRFRRARLLCFAAAALAMLLLPQTSGASHQSKIITVRAETVLKMKGSSIYCTVVTTRGAPSVACFYSVGSGANLKRKGYAVVATENYVAVEPSGSTTPVVLKRQPSLASEPKFSGGKASSALITVNPGDLVAIGGTHMGVTVAPAKGGGTAIGILYLDGNDSPIVGTYTVGISNHFVTIVKVTGPSKSSTTYRHAVLP